MVTDGMKESCHELIDNRQLNYHRYCQGPWLMEHATVTRGKGSDPEPLPGDSVTSKGHGARCAGQGGNPVYVAGHRLAGPVPNTTAWRFHTLPPPMQV
ncbi:hypothetical protein F7725_021911 [Dissostichus mawsoni]|uniref:Uncharacterized protein n=1 Tax=Dissostichus mawsoni TaxID=36200 RepID=A0A7J5ZCI2_DISMA|nr:hypothetical protein F7725_021911 [Dissostichus mawsoni]